MTKWYSAKAKKNTEQTGSSKRWDNQVSTEVLKQIAGGRMPDDYCHNICK